MSGRCCFFLSKPSKCTKFARKIELNFGVAFLNKNSVFWPPDGIV